MIQITKITTQKPRNLSKSFKLGTKGKLVKTAGGQMIVGIAERLRLNGVEELALELQKLKPTNALTYGLSIHERARVVTKQALAKAQARSNGGLPIIARTREHFSYSKGAGVLMLDYDPEPNAPNDAFMEGVYTVCPEIKNAPHLLASSASSYIYKNEECLKGPGGLRLLVVVKGAQDIPRAGDVFFKRCWLHGLGHIFISKSGAMLLRTIIDASVFQPERLDFCGGAHCKKPLEQRRPAPQIFNADAEILDTNGFLKPLTLSEEAKFQKLTDEAMQDARPESERIQNKWINEHVHKSAKHLPEDQRESVKETFTLAARNQILLGDFILTLADGKTVTVGEILDNPDKWHGKRCADPLEPSYNGDRRIAYINLRAAGRNYIWSHAHGGRRYSFSRARKTIRLIDGERAATVRKVLELMRINGAHYRRAGEIVSVTPAGEVIARDRDGLLFDIDGMARSEKYDRRNEAWRACDCKANIATGVMAAKGTWRLPELAGVSTAPCMDPVTGRLIDADGFDKQSGLMLILNDVSRWHGIPEKPEAVEVKEAAQRLFKPFKDFPYDSDISRGVWLNAVLTAVIRQMLPTAPGVSITSPVAGSGKSLIGKCFARISGDVPAMLPDVGDAEEFRKRLLALLRQNKRIMILDNVVGTFASAALCAMLTTPDYEDRILGKTEVISVPTRALLVITGNNVTLRGDLCRRILTCRIDPEMETPWKRCFNLDPAEYCRTHRLEMVRDALIIVRAGIQNGPEMPDRTASFEEWSDSVRRAVCLVGRSGFLDVDDPVKSIDNAYALDPETAKLSALVEAWWQIWGDIPIKVAVLIQSAADTMNSEGSEWVYVYPELKSALYEIAGEGKSINPRRLGRWIEKNSGRIVDRKRIVEAGWRDGVRQWRMRNEGVSGV